MTCIAVSGGTGFLGQRVLQRLLASGDDVVLVVRRPTAIGRTRTGMRSTPSVLVHNGTTAELADAFRHYSVEAVAHLATHFVAEHQPDDIERLVSANVLLGTQLAEAAISNGVCRFVNIGSQWQHEGNGDVAYKPLNLYAATKQAFEDILAYYTQARGLCALHLEMCDTYGPGDTRRKLIASLLSAAARNETLPMSPGEQLLDLIHVDDAANAVTLALRMTQGMQAGETARFSVTSGSPVALRDLVALLAATLGREIRVAWGSRPYRPREVMVPRATYEPLPGWEVSISIADGFASLAECP